MALTRKMLKGMGLTEEQVDTIIESHSEVVDGLKDQISASKETDAELLKVKKELEKTKADLAAEKKGSWKVKYDSLKEEYDTYKAEQGKKEAHAAKESAYRDLLKSIGINEKRISAVMKVSDIDGVELDTDGRVKDAEILKKDLASEWEDFIVTTSTKGADTPKPPANTGGTTTTKDDILKIKDPVARQDAIAKNLSLFSKSEKE